MKNFSVAAATLEQEIYHAQNFTTDLVTRNQCRHVSKQTTRRKQEQERKLIANSLRIAYAWFVQNFTTLAPCAFCQTILQSQPGFKKGRRNFSIKYQISFPSSISKRKSIKYLFQSRTINLALTHSFSIGGIRDAFGWKECRRQAQPQLARSANANTLYPPTNVSTVHSRLTKVHKWASMLASKRIASVIARANLGQYWSEVRKLHISGAQAMSPFISALKREAASPNNFREGKSAGLDFEGTRSYHIVAHKDPSSNETKQISPIMAMEGE